MKLMGKELGTDVRVFRFPRDTLVPQDPYADQNPRDTKGERKAVFPHAPAR